MTRIADPDGDARPAPAQAVDQALRDRRQDHGADGAAAHAEGERRAQARLEPASRWPASRPSARWPWRRGRTRRTARRDATDAASAARSRRRRRRRSTIAGRMTRRGPKRSSSMPVKRRAHRHGHGGDAEGGRDRLAIPGERLGDRLQEDAERVDQDRREADEHAERRCGGDAPPFVAGRVLVELGRDGADGGLHLEHQPGRELHQPRRAGREDAAEVGRVEVGDRQAEVGVVERR